MSELTKFSAKELYYVADTSEHRKKVRDVLQLAVQEILSRGRMHDDSKYDPVEMDSYVEPVWALNHEEVSYGSERYKELTALMGPGWEHHKTTNDHHIEFLRCADPVPSLNLFILLEMCADWIAAASRRGNDPALALDGIKAKYPLDAQVEALMRNTIADLVKWSAAT